MEILRTCQDPPGRLTDGYLPFCGGRDISPTLPRKIAADVRVTVEELLAGRRCGPSRRYHVGLGTHRSPWFPMFPSSTCTFPPSITA